MHHRPDGYGRVEGELLEHAVGVDDDLAHHGGRAGVGALEEVDGAGEPVLEVAEVLLELAGEFIETEQY